MRVGLVIYGSLEQASGGYLYDRKLVEHLKGHGHAVELISLPWRNYVSHLSDNFSSTLLRRLENSRIDVLLQDELNHASLFLLNSRLKRRVNYPIISIVHHLRSSEQQPKMFSALYRLFERRYLNSVDGFIFNSLTTQHVVEQLIKRRKPNVVAQPAGDRINAEIREDEIRGRAVATWPLRIVFLGSLIRRKAPHVLIQAVAMVQGAAASFVGSGDSEPKYALELRRMVSRLKLEGRVYFLGYLDQRELAPLLRASHVLVVPSSYEGYGIAYLEGMSFGLPAIGTRAGGASEIITHGKDGYLIEVGNVAELAQYLQDLQADRELLATMGVAARQRYLAHPTWQNSLVRIEEFLSSYNSAKPRPSD